MDIISSEEVLARLALLQGVWEGQGKGQFPTIDSFEYKEHLEFEVDLSYPLIHYQQRTILIPTNEHSHWESGFIRVLDNGKIEISNSQDSGRVEVLQGTMTVGPDVELEAQFEIEFSSIALANDPRLIQTKRILKLNKNKLTYDNYMITNTTDKPALLHHLSARLERVNVSC